MIMCECSVLVPQKFPEPKGVIICCPKSIQIADAGAMLGEKKKLNLEEILIALKITNKKGPS